MEKAGILRPWAAEGRFEVERREPPGDLAGLVAYVWLLTWDLRGQAAHRQQVLTDPSVHLAYISDGRAEVTGVQRGFFIEEISGVGRVIGIRFRPGGFRPFMDGPVSLLTDRTVAVEELYGRAARNRAETIIGTAPISEAVELTLGFLRSLHPPADPLVEEAAGLVDLIAEAPWIQRVSDLAGACGLGARRLQRLFAEYVGVGPKWVIRRTRIHEAAARAGAGVADWAALAADLGYSDQAHFVRDFTAAIGTPPDRYARECPAPAPSAAGESGRA